MSVINKMLRDLDQRHAPADAALPHTRAARVPAGTVSVATDSLAPARRGRKAWWAAGVAGAGLLAAGAWWGWSVSPAPPVSPLGSAVPEPALVVPSLPARVALAPASVPVAAPRVAVKANAPYIARPVAAPPAVVVRAPAPVTAPAPAAPLVSAAPASTGNVPKAAVPVAAPAADVPPAQRQQQAARDALAQSQVLWNAGSHDAATELLQQALGLADRNASSSPSAANTQVLASLARELARMHLADGRAAAAADLLSRLQAPLAQEADIWALRANAAQRLGRHQESVSDYTTALQWRPNEQRWLLGAAVSLAAQGQTANATAMAERARAVGPISREVQTYLRQAGVQIREP